MKSLVIVLAALFLVLQYKLWFDQGGIRQVETLKKAITTQNKENQQLSQRNQVLVAEVQDLKSGQAAIEEHARNDLGMIKPGETFYQVVDDKK